MSGSSGPRAVRKRTLPVDRVAVVSVMLMTGLLSLGAAAGWQSDERTSDTIALQKLKDNLYLLTGAGGNSLAFVTDLGVVLVDTKAAGHGRAILDTLKGVTAKPVTTIINTHAHPENVGGNEFFPASVEIVAQESTRLNMDRMPAFKGVKVNDLPKLMFKEKMTIGSGKQRVDLYFTGPAHTGGDAWVVFPSLRVAHVGDLVTPRQLPIIDFENGGSGLAYPDTLAKAAPIMMNVDIVVPGVGAPITRKDVDAYVGLMKTFRETVVSGFDHGLSITEIAEEWERRETYRSYSAPPERVKADVTAIVAELTRQP